MYAGDKARKQTLVEFGFRLPSAFDNRPLQFEETMQRIGQTIYVSATPAEFEEREAGGKLVEQIIRPTGLLDPIVEVRSAETQVDDCLAEIRTTIATGGRILVTVLTKRLAEELSKYLEDLRIRAKYLHSDIDTVERMQIIRDLRAGTFDVLVGINLLREGLDIPEVSLVCILDADKEGFLRSETSLVQTCGRAARNAEGRVIMYAYKETPAIRHTIALTKKRRAIQEAYNKEHGITPRTVVRDINPLIQEVEELPDLYASNKKGRKVAEKKEEYVTIEQVRERITEHEKEMKQASKELRFEDAATSRDLMRKFQLLELELS
jgi:excinuclease ABC subunit B